MAGAGTPMGDHRASQAYRIAMLRNSLLKFYAQTKQAEPTEGAGHE
jgi:xanthine dehydrogenase small subunit